ncbi:hypothetical protein AK830_g1596 [Neonectria ditissima]|uniref:Xylanolytic transcriptional activator regulatory domain-containing protein n=1 Tax=Neonectria ditissima TaxID=78410 RepID=A0A0P7BTX4_9HYPO|nr:hypothetical protein AK830_g1596 [Neonectria ditissima]
MQDYFDQCSSVKEDQKEQAGSFQGIDTASISEHYLDLGPDFESYILTIMGGESFLDPFDAFEFPSPSNWDLNFQFENGDGWNFRSNPIQLQARLAEISSELLSSSRNVPLTEKPRSLSDSVHSIFVVDKVPSFIQSYFDNWHRHCPMLHQPLFEPSSTPSPLLSAVILIGAIYLSQESAAAARDCLSTAEDYIFEHEAFQRLVYPQSQQDTVEDIAPLQAAFLMAILQHWDNHEGSRRRIRLQRYSDLVSAARHLGLPSLRHSVDHEIGLPSSEQDWKLFVKTEEGIRLMIWIFLVDSSHAIFHRTPPRLTLTEMTGSLPCEEGLFNLRYRDLECKLKMTQCFSAVPSLAKGMSLLMADEWPDSCCFETEYLSCLDLFVLISGWHFFNPFLPNPVLRVGEADIYKGLHEIIFSTYATCSLSLARDAIFRALERWKALWDLHMERVPRSEMDRLGFFKNAGEYWWLAKLFLEKSMPEIKGQNKEASDRDSMEEVNSFVKFLDLSIQ